MLAPGGTLLFAGEPSRYGDRLARVPKRFAATLAPAVAARDRRAVPRRATRAAEPTRALEGVVDVHAFAPARALRAARAARACSDVRVSGEELLANWFGWTNRTLEATAEPEQVPWAWRQYAYRGYLLLQELDRGLLEPRLPAAIFYNLMISRAQARLSASRRRTRPLHGPRPRLRRCPSDAPRAFRCSRWGSWRCPARACRCTSSRTATGA